MPPSRLRQRGGNLQQTQPYAESDHAEAEKFVVSEKSLKGRPPRGVKSTDTDNAEEIVARGRRDSRRQIPAGGRMGAKAASPAPQSPRPSFGFIFPPLCDSLRS